MRGATAVPPWGTWPVFQQRGHALLCSITDRERYSKKEFVSESKVTFILIQTAATPSHDILHAALYGAMLF